jgi:hypothetical protein
VLDRDTGEEVAALAGKFQPAVFASHIDPVGRWYNGAPVQVERNNHGHAVLLWLRNNNRLYVLAGHDGGEGWLSSSKGKALLYDGASDAFREGATVLHSFATFTQLASIEGSTLRATEGESDDRADAYALACVGCRMKPRSLYVEGPLLCWPPLPGRGDDMEPLDPQAKPPKQTMPWEPEPDDGYGGVLGEALRKMDEEEFRGDAGLLW